MRQPEQLTPPYVRFTVVELVVAPLLALMGMEYVPTAAELVSQRDSVVLQVTAHPGFENVADTPAGKLGAEK